MVKDVVFIGGADEDLRRFPPSARQRSGYQLYLVQVGAEPADWKPMATIGSGCREIRVRDESGAKADIDLGKARYKAMRALIEETNP
jgi:phage-related protein